MLLVCPKCTQQAKDEMIPRVEKSFRYTFSHVEGILVPALPFCQALGFSSVKCIFMVVVFFIYKQIV